MDSKLLEIDQSRSTSATQHKMNEQFMHLSESSKIRCFYSANLSAIELRGRIMEFGRSLTSNFRCLQARIFAAVRVDDSLRCSLTTTDSNLEYVDILPFVEMYVM